MSKVATKAQREAVIAACGKYHGSQQPGWMPTIKTQEKLHRRAMDQLGKFKEEDHAQIWELARAWWNNKPMKGPGVDW